MAPPLLRGGRAAILAFALSLGAALAQPVDDLPPGWVLDQTYIDYGTIRYVAPDAKFRVDIHNEDATELGAAAWLDAYLDDQAARYTVVDRGDTVPAYDMMGALEDGAEAATATFAHRYGDGPVQKRIVTAIVRPGEPVTMINVDGMKGMPTPDELRIASDLAVRTVVRTEPGIAARKIQAGEGFGGATVQPDSLRAAFRGVLSGEVSCKAALGAFEAAESEDDKLLGRTVARICAEKAKDTGDHEHQHRPGAVSPAVAALPPSGPERRAAIREMARKAARERYGHGGAAAGRVGADLSAPPKGDGHVGIAEVVHQSRDTYSGDFLDVEHHVYFLYEDGTAIRSPNIAIIDVGKEISREEWPSGWFEWRRKDGKLQVRSIKRPEWWTPGGSLTTLSPSEAGLRLDGRYKYARTSGSMVFGSSVVFRTYTFTADGRYEQSSESMVGGGADLGAGPGALGAASCDKDGQRSAVATGNPVAPGASSTGPGCGKANEGRYHVDGYAITLAADNGRVYRLPFYRPYDGLLLIGGYWYGEQ